MQQYTYGLKVDLNDTQLETLESLCARSGLTKAALIRKLIMEQEIRQRPDADFLELVQAIGRLNRDLNRVLRKGDTLFTEPTEEMKEAAKIMRGVRAEIDRWKKKWL